MDSAKPIYINLLLREQHQSKKVSPVLIVCLLLLFIGIGLGCWHSHMQNNLRSMRTLNYQLKAELGQYKEHQLKLRSYHNLCSKVEAKQERVIKISQAQIGGLEVYSEIEQAVPDGLVLTGIEINKEKVLVNGYAAEYQELATLLSGLRKSTLLQNVMLLSSNIDDKSGEVLFKVEMGWEASKK